MNFVNEVDNVKKLIVENTQYMRSFEGTGDKLRDELKKFNDEILNMRLELGENLIRLKTKQKRLDQILEDAAASSNTLEEFEIKYADLNRAEGKKRNNVKQTVEYKELKAMMQNNLNASNAGDDDDLIVETLENDDNACSMYDPWTKGLMQHPMRNTRCGHHYDRESVMSVIKNNMSIRCPVVGCASKTYIQPNHLEEDLSLLQKIKEYMHVHDALNALSSEDDD